MVVLICLLVRGRVGPFVLSYSMGTLTKDPGTPAPVPYKFLHPSSERPGMWSGWCFEEDRQRGMFLLKKCNWIQVCCRDVLSQLQGKEYLEVTQTWQIHPAILYWERDRRQRNKKARERLFTRAYSDRTRGNGFKLKEGRFRVDIWKKLLTVRVVRYWNRLSREVVDASSLEVFQDQTGWGFGQSGLVGGVPVHGRGLD